MKDKCHKYEYEVDTTLETAPAYVVRMVGQNKRVLEIGCGPGSISRVLSQQGRCQVTGLELDSEAITKVAPYCVKVIQADLNSSEWPHFLDVDEKFDVVVAADVLEHLYDPWDVLQRMVPLINSDGYLVISIPNVGHAAVMACLINGDFEYSDTGLLDSTHIRFFGPKNIETLFAQANLKIIEARYVIKLPEETELALSWSKLSLATQRALMRGKYSEVYQVVVKAVPINFAGDAVLLAPPQHTYRRTLGKIAILWKIRIGQILSPQLKKRIRKVIKLLGMKL